MVDDERFLNKIPDVVSIVNSNGLQKKLSMSVPWLLQNLVGSVILGLKCDL